MRHPDSFKDMSNSLPNDEDEVDLTLTFTPSKEQSKPLSSKGAKPVGNTEVKVDAKTSSVPSEKGKNPSSPKATKLIEDAEDKVVLDLKSTQPQEQSKPLPSKPSKPAEDAGAKSERKVTKVMDSLSSKDGKPVEHTEDKDDVKATSVSSENRTEPLPLKDEKPVENTEDKVDLDLKFPESQNRSEPLSAKNPKTVEGDKTNLNPKADTSKMQTRNDNLENKEEDSIITELKLNGDDDFTSSPSTRPGGGAPGDAPFINQVPIKQDPNNTGIMEEIDTGDNGPNELETEPEETYSFKGLRAIYTWTIMLLGGWATFSLLQKIVAFYADLQGMAPWIKWTLGSAFALLIGCILVLLFTILRFMYRLPRKADILSELERRKAYRKLRGEKLNEACKELAKLLIPKDGKEEYEKTLKELGFTAEEIEPVINKPENLQQMHEDRLLPDSQWIAEYRSYQNECLEKLAYDLIKKTSAKAALLATISPFPMGDRLVILSLSLQMLKQLMLIYHLRPSTFNAWILLSQISLTSYASGYTQNAALKLGDFAKKLTAGLPVVEGIVQATTQLTTEAALHGVLVYRIGEQIVKKLRVIN